MKNPQGQIPMAQIELLLGSSLQIWSQTGKNLWRNFRHFWLRCRGAFCPSPWNY